MSRIPHCKGESSFAKLIVCSLQLLEDLRSKEKDLKNQVEMIEGLKKGKHTLLQLENEYVWAVVKESEDIWHKASNELAAASKRLDTLKEEREEIAEQARLHETSQA